MKFYIFNTVILYFKYIMSQTELEHFTSINITDLVVNYYIRRTQITPINLYSLNLYNYDRYFIINALNDVNYDDSDDSGDDDNGDDSGDDDNGDDEKNMTPEEVFTLKGISITYKPCEIEEEECPILGKPDCITCCNHAFCQESLAKWLRKNDHCPLCRNTIVEINIPPV